MKPFHHYRGPPFLRNRNPFVRSAVTDISPNRGITFQGRHKDLSHSFKMTLPRKCDGGVPLCGHNALCPYDIHLYSAVYYFFIPEALPARLAFSVLRLALKLSVYHFRFPEALHAILRSAFCILHLHSEAFRINQARNYE